MNQIDTRVIKKTFVTIVAYRQANFVSILKAEFLYLKDKIEVSRDISSKLVQKWFKN